MEANDNRNKPSIPLKEVVVGIIVFCLILIPFLNGGVLKFIQKLSVPDYPFLDYQRFHGDENHWLHSSKYFKLLFMDRDISNKQWQEPEAYDQPPVGKYIIGLALFVAGEGDEIEELEKMSVWDFSKNYSWNVANGTIPPPKLLSTARLTMALFGIFTCLLLYYIGKEVFSVRTGIIASLLLAYNPLMLSWSRRAMTDALLLFFLMTNVVLMMFFYKSFLKEKSRKSFVFAALIGMNVAFASGTKLNGALTGIIFASFCIFVVLMKIIQYKFLQHINKLKTIKELKIIVGSLLVSGFIAIFIFIGINPYLYRQPLDGIAGMVEHRMLIVEAQQEQTGPSLDVEFTGPALTSLNKKVNFVVKRTLFPNGYVTLGNILKLPVDLCLFILGVAVLLYVEFKCLRENYIPSLRSIVIIWLVITFTGMTVWIPIDWQRYYLPFVPCIVMMLGYGIDKVICNLGQLKNKRQIAKLQMT